MMLVGWILAIGFGAFGAKDPEDVVYSFETTNRKIVELSYDEEERVFTYRLLSKGKVELEVRDDLNDSDTVFTVDGYFRGGGTQNGAMEWNDVMFDRNGYEYDVYYSWAAPEEEGQKESPPLYGVRVVKDGKEVADLKGKRILQGGVSGWSFFEILPRQER